MGRCRGMHSGALKKDRGLLMGSLLLVAVDCIHSLGGDVEWV
jgi:hypothetical protein